VAGVPAAPPGPAAAVGGVGAFGGGQFAGTIFEDVAIHIIEPPGIRLEAADRCGIHVSVGIVGFQVVVAVPDIGIFADAAVFAAKEIIGLRACPAGNFPFFERGEPHSCPGAIGERVAIGDTGDGMVHAVPDTAAGDTIGPSPVGGAIPDPAELFEAGLEDHGVVVALRVVDVVGGGDESGELTVGGFVDGDREAVDVHGVQRVSEAAFFADGVGACGDSDETGMGVWVGYR